MSTESKIDRDSVKQDISPERETDRPGYEDAIDTGKRIKEHQENSEIEKLKRTDGSSKHLYYVGIVFLYTVSLAILAMILVLAWHYAAPEKERFLTDPEVSKLQSFLLSGLIGGGLTNGVKRIFGP